MASIPFLGHRAASDVVAYRGARAVSAAEFATHAAQLAARLPARNHLINLCGDRYHFTVGLAAALMCRQASLLPPHHTPELLRQLSEAYPGVYALVDGPFDTTPLDQMAFPELVESDASVALPAFAAEQIAAIAFTSGSTGQPTAHPKSWGSLTRGAAAEAACLGLVDFAAAPVTLVGTVPPQHMYGLESSVMLALRNGCALHAARPFYPADIRAALEQCPAPRILVTTPVHLRALLAEEIQLPALALIVCATAPLAVELATQAEQRFAAPVREIYGFTEAGQVASRRTVQGAQWHTLPGVQARQDEQGTWFGGGPIEHEALVTDIVELRDAQRFILHGRGADLVNIAGKRTSLAYLNQQLNSIDGVRDGVFFMPDENPQAITRVMAFVVTDHLSRAELLESLRQRIDSAFLPRPLYFVSALPRNATGKLPREALQQLAAACADAGAAS